MFSILSNIEEDRAYEKRRIHSQKESHLVELVILVCLANHNDVCLSIQIDIIDSKQNSLY